MSTLSSYLGLDSLPATSPAFDKTLLCSCGVEVKGQRERASFQTELGLHVNGSVVRHWPACFSLNFIIAFSGVLKAVLCFLGETEAV